MSECAIKRNNRMIGERLLKNICELEWERFFKGERASINALKQAYNYVARKHLFRKIVNMFRNKNLTIDNFMKYASAKVSYRNTEEIKQKFADLEKVYTLIELNDEYLAKMSNVGKIQNIKERLGEIKKIDANALKFYKHIQEIDSGLGNYIKDGIQNGTIKEIKDFPIYILGEDITSFLEMVNNEFKKLDIDKAFIPFDFNMGDDIIAKEIRATRGFGGQQIRFDKFREEWNKRTQEEKQEITEEFLRDELNTNTLKQALKNTNFPLFDRNDSIVIDGDGNITPQIIDIILNSNTYIKNEMYMMGGKKSSKKSSKKTSKKTSKKSSKKSSKKNNKKTSKKSLKKNSKKNSKRK
jgi:hypothetical protein